jgi:hypothetical protein
MLSLCAATAAVATVKAEASERRKLKSAMNFHLPLPSARRSKRDCSLFL